MLPQDGPCPATGRGKRHRQKLALEIVVVRSLLLFVAVCVLLGLLWLPSEPGACFTTDTALRYLQVKEWMANGWTSMAIDHPVGLDPHFRHVPLYWSYSVVEGGVYLNISPYLPLLTSLLVSRLGEWALPILPILGAMLAAWALSRLGTLSGYRHAGWLFPAALFATPLLFYGQVFWDHSLGTGLALAGLYGAASGLVHRHQIRLALGGVCMALAVAQRFELVFLAAAAGVVLCWLARTRVVGFVLGATLTCLAIGAVELQLCGHPLGMVAANRLCGYGRVAFPAMEGMLPGAPATVPGYLLLGSDDRWMSDPVSYTLLAGLLLLLVARLGSRRFRLVVVVGLALCLAAYASFALDSLFAGDSPDSRGMVRGLLPSLPLLPFAFLGLWTGAGDRATTPIRRLCLGSWLLYLVLACALLPAHGGVQWASRYLLPASCLALLLAWPALTSCLEEGAPRGLRVLACALAALSLCMQGMSLVHLHEEKHLAESYRRMVRGWNARLLLTDRAFLPPYLAGLGTRVLYYAQPEDLEALLERIRLSGVEEVVVYPRGSAPARRVRFE